MHLTQSFSTQKNLTEAVATAHRVWVFPGCSQAPSSPQPLPSFLSLLWLGRSLTGQCLRKGTDSLLLQSPAPTAARTGAWEAAGEEGHSSAPAQPGSWSHSWQRPSLFLIRGKLPRGRKRTNLQQTREHHCSVLSLRHKSGSTKHTKATGKAPGNIIWEQKSSWVIKARGDWA